MQLEAVTVTEVDEGGEERRGEGGEVRAGPGWTGSVPPAAFINMAPLHT